MVIDVEALFEDLVDGGQRVILTLPLRKARGIKAKGKIRAEPDTATKAYVQAGEKRHGFDVLKIKGQLRQIEDHQVGRFAQQHSDRGRGIGDQGQPDPAAGNSTGLLHRLLFRIGIGKVLRGFVGIRTRPLRLRSWLGSSRARLPQISSDHEGTKVQQHRVAR